MQRKEYIIIFAGICLLAVIAVLALPHVTQPETLAGQEENGSLLHYFRRSEQIISLI